MIIKGTSRAGPAALAAHLGNAETNERVRVLETRGTIAGDLRGALLEMDAYAAGSRCEKSLYHAAISPEPPHKLTPEQRSEAIDALEAKLGLEGHARVAVLHEKLGREHLHVVWSRIDLQSMTAVHDGHNFRKHEEVSRDLERRFGHERVQGAHAERDGIERPDRTPSRAELRQEERTGIKGRDVKDQVTEAFRASDSPEAFQAALADAGYQLAKGDRRDFVIVDRAGGVHSLARRIDGVAAAELREFMTPIDRESLPSVEEARAAASERAEQLRDSLEEALIERAYSRGADYVSQTRAALREHARRQRELEAIARRDPAWERVEAGEASRDQSRREEDARRSEEAHVAEKSGKRLDTIEMTEGQLARMERLLSREHRDRERGETHDEDDPSRQHEAPGGRSRSQ